jgi:hypothetical protein
MLAQTSRRVCETVTWLRLYLGFPRPFLGRLKGGYMFDAAIFLLVLCGFGLVFIVVYAMLTGTSIQLGC